MKGMWRASAIGMVAVGLSCFGTASWAGQHDAHGAAPSAPAAPGGMAGMACMEGAGGMRALVDGLAAEVEKGRQANNPAAMRAALESVQSSLAKLRAHMARCSENMSKMSSAQGGSADHAGHGAAATAPPAASSTQGAEPKSAWTISITPNAYEPESIVVKQGVKTTLTFIRKTEQTCATEIVFPDFDIEKPLPLNEPVVIEITPTKTGEFRFTCGMNMYKGKMVVK
jgi:plastocyanin